jgi:hypothetical protein
MYLMKRKLYGDKADTEGTCSGQGTGDICIQIIRRKIRRNEFCLRKTLSN